VRLDCLDIKAKKHQEEAERVGHKYLRPLRSSSSSSHPKPRPTKREAFKPDIALVSAIDYTQR
jgi:hypothetical protein